MAKKIQTIQFFFREDNEVALGWKESVTKLITTEFPEVKVVNEGGEGLIVLGGDGTILQAARKFREQAPLLLGLNLGTVGFLASVREEKDFEEGVRHFLSGNYCPEEHLLLSVAVMRNKEVIFNGLALNDIVVQNLLGMVDLEIAIKGHPFQSIRGSGVLISTPTGSTAYNLSAHGPIVMPEIKGVIVTELLDHNIPTPSIVVQDNKQIDISVKSFRKRGWLEFTETKEPVDVILVVDGEAMFPLKEGDQITIAKSNTSVQFVQIEDNYFLKSLGEKFSFN